MKEIQYLPYSIYRGQIYGVHIQGHKEGLVAATFFSRLHIVSAYQQQISSGLVPIGYSVRSTVAHLQSDRGPRSPRIYQSQV